MKIEVDFDEEEAKHLIKEQWYREARREVKQQMSDIFEHQVNLFIKEKLKDFEKILKEATIEVLKCYKIKDLKQVNRLLGKDFPKIKKNT